MNIFIKTFVCFWSILLFSLPASANWKVSKKAVVNNQEKNVMIIERMPNGRVLAKFVLQNEIKDLFKFKLPIYKVDNNKIRDFKTAKNLIISEKTNQISWILWEIFDGKGPPNKELLEIMMGKNLILQYYIPDGAIKETSFELKGAFEAISEILY